MITVVDPGPFTTVQDLGRTGYAHLGVGRSGAFDRHAFAAANRLVGNPRDAAGLEITSGGLHLVVQHAATVALTGADGPASLDRDVAVSLPAGARITVGRPATGLRSYLAVRGGIHAEAALGSRSTDTLAGLGPAPLQVGTVLTIGRQPRWPVDGSISSPRRVGNLLRVVLGPRVDWFTASATATLTAATWTVRTESNRIGLRLAGPELGRTGSDELPSEATLPGALQVPPSGRPVLLGPDAPVTGGYPVIAVVRDADLDLAAQLAPGDQLRFVIA